MEEKERRQPPLVVVVVEVVVVVVVGGRGTLLEKGDEEGGGLVGCSVKEGKVGRLVSVSRMRASALHLATLHGHRKR